MTSFLISFPDIAANVWEITSITTTEDEDHPVENVISGERNTFFRLSATANVLDVKYKLKDGDTRTADHFIIARADWLQTQGMTRALLQNSSDDVSYANVVNDTSFDSATLVGPRQEDYVTTFSTSTARQYWKAVVDTGSVLSQQVSKFYFGDWFDFTVEPDDYTITKVFNPSTFYSGDGTQHVTRSSEPRYVIKVIWRGITDALTESFLKTALHPKTNTCFLYTATQTEILNEETLIHCRVTDASATMIWNDWNIVSATFEEMIG